MYKTQNKKRQELVIFFDIFAKIISFFQLFSWFFKILAVH